MEDAERGPAAPSNDGRLQPGVIPTPHKGQKELLDLKARYRIGVCGRRFGKTFAAAIAAVELCKSNDDQRVWWISPVQEQSDRVEREIARWVLTPKPERGAKRGKDADDTIIAPAPQKDEHQDEPPKWSHRKLDHALLYSNGSRIEFHSAHLADNLRGAGLELVIVDEAADISEYAWKMVIKPMLLDAKGRAFIIGTPRGTNHWLHRIFLMGSDPARAERYESKQLSTRDNPRIDKQEIEDYREEMTPEEFEQEIEAKFIDDVNAMFPRVDRMEKCALRESGRPGVGYITGIDLGRKVDFTVLCSVTSAEPHLMEGFARFNMFEWHDQLVRIAEHLRRFPGPCVVDATGVGDALFEDIHALASDAHSFVFKAANKGKILHRLSLKLNHGLVLGDCADLVRELKAFRAVTQTSDMHSTPRTSYGAPRGLHDDCVIALALAWWGVETIKTGSQVHSGNPLMAGLFAG